MASNDTIPLNVFVDMIPTIISIVIVSPLILIGSYRSPNSNRWTLIGICVLLTILDCVSTMIESFTGPLQPAELHFNWIGKLTCIVLIVVTTGLLPPKFRSASGLFNLPQKNSLWPVVGFLTACLLLGVVGGIGMLHSRSQQHQVNAEAVAYQLIMPSLAEEPMYRAIMPALLAAAIGSPWTFCGAKVGWWWLAIAAYFGFGHALQWSPDVGVTFQSAPFFLTGTVGLVFGWMAARCGSVWPCVLGHTLINAPVFAIPLAVKSLQVANAIYFTFSLAA